MPDAIPDLFSVIRPTDGRRQVLFDQAITTLRHAVQAGSIRKVEHDTIKSHLGNAVDRAWTDRVSEPFFHAGRFRDQPREVYELYNSIMISSLHDCLSAKKKIDRAGLSGPVIGAMRSVLAEAHPLAEAARDMKAHIIKGRTPNPAPPPPNPDKKIGTCSCCFRGIAYNGSGMAHHGYERPGNGQQTSSCSGIRFQPLEISLEGLEWVIGTTADKLERLTIRLSEAPQLTQVFWMERKLPMRQPTLQKCGVGEPEWPRRHRQHIEGIRTDILHTSAALEMYRREMCNWQAYHGIDPEKSDDDPETPGLSGL